MKLLATVVLAGAAFAAAASAANAPSIRIVETRLVPGVYGTAVEVRVEIAGFRMYPPDGGEHADGGHWHVLVDGKLDTGTTMPVGYTNALAPGKHRIAAELRTSSHGSLDPPVVSAEVVVEIPRAAAPAKAKPKSKPKKRR